MATLANLTVNDTGYLQVASGTGAQRPTPATGMVRYNSDRTEIEVYNGTTWISGQNATANVVTNGIVLYLDAGNPSSYAGTGTTWTDLSGSNYNGTLTNGPTFNTGNQGYISFDGSNDYVSGSLGSLSTWSMCLWYYSTDITTAQVYYPFSGTTTASGIGFGGTLNSSTSGRWYFFDGTNTLSSTTTAVSVNTWYYLVVTKSGTSYNLYTNGVLSLSTTGVDLTINTYNLGRRGDGNWYVVGRIPIAQIYNRALSVQEVRQNFLATAGRYNIGTSIFPPSAPTGVTAAISGPGYTTMSVSFTAPLDNGGSTITSYTVTSSPGGVTGTGSASPIAVSGLTAGTAYTFTVTATNAAGTGPASAASASVSTIAYPTGGTITTSGTNRIHTFTANGTFGTSASTSTNIYMWGAGGGGGGGGAYAGNTGGAGVYLTKAYTFASGSFTVTVGAGGNPGTYFNGTATGGKGLGGAPGGGNGGDAYSGNNAVGGGGGGGGYTRIITSGSVIVALAGGGGGGGGSDQSASGTPGIGGLGGGPNGGNGGLGSGSIDAGKGGTTTAGGAGSTATFPGTSGSSLTGGSGGAGNTAAYGGPGGGGAGLYGGGGGGTAASTHPSGGGGGSSTGGDAYTQGSGATAPQTGSAYYGGGAAAGGTAGAINGNGGAGGGGRVVIVYSVV